MSKETVFILIGSRKRVGKDTAAKILEEKFKALGRRVGRMAFADALKTEVQTMFSTCVGIDKHIDARTEDPWLKENVVRPVLIAWGCARRALDPNYWVDKIATRAEGHSLVDTPDNLDPHHFVIVSDWRFPNEFTRLQEIGYVVRGVDIDRPDVPNVIPEEIENSPKCRALSLYWLVNGSTVDRLKDQLENLAENFNEEFPNRA